MRRERLKKLWMNLVFYSIIIVEILFDIIFFSILFLWGFFIKL